MKKRLTEQDVFSEAYLNKVRDNKVIFKEGLDKTTKEFHAFMLACYSLKGENLGLSEKMAQSAKMRDFVYDAALIFFEKYPFSCNAIEKCWEQLGSTGRDFFGNDYEKFIWRSLFSLGLEFGDALTHLRGGASPYGGYPSPTYEKYPAEYSSDQNLFDNVFSKPEVLLYVIKNTWLGRLSLAEHYKEAKVSDIPEEDLSILKNVELGWNRDWKDTNPEAKLWGANFRGTNLRFIGRESKEGPDISGNYAACLNGHPIWKKIELGTMKQTAPNRAAPLILFLGGLAISAVVSVHYPEAALLQLVASSALSNMVPNIALASIVGILVSSAIIKGIEFHYESQGQSKSQ